MSAHDLDALIRAAKSASTPSVLATVVATRGSTYRKEGARMLLGPQGALAGIVGGGCFDADLAEQARGVIESDRPALLTYDMRSPDDAIWGLGLGCEGAADILLQTPAQTAATLELLESLLEVQGGRVRTCIDPENECFGVSESVADRAPAGSWFDEEITLPPQLLVCGAGVDAQPLVALAAACGWRVTVLDHRPAMIKKERFPEARRMAQFDGGPLEGFDAAVIMSHNLLADVRYLEALAGTSIGYIGALGPTQRRALLLEQVEGAIDPEIVRGPAGLDLGGELPEAIALSIVAEIQALHHGGNARPWTGQGRK